MPGSMKDALKRAGLAKEEPAPRKISKEFREELPDDESLPPRFEGPAMTVAMPLGETAPARPGHRAPTPQVPVTPGGEGESEGTGETDPRATPDRSPPE